MSHQILAAELVLDMVHQSTPVRGTEAKGKVLQVWRTFRCKFFRAQADFDELTTNVAYILLF